MSVEMSIAKLEGFHRG